MKTIMKYLFMLALMLSCLSLSVYTKDDTQEVTIKESGRNTKIELASAGYIEMDSAYVSEDMHAEDIEQKGTFLPFLQKTIVVTKTGEHAYILPDTITQYDALGEKHVFVYTNSNIVKNHTFATTYKRYPIKDIVVSLIKQS